MLDDDELVDYPQPKRVVRTGIALVHEGELVLPAAGSEAEAELAGADSRTVVQYIFPVEIEVCASRRGADANAVADLVFERLLKRLEET
ncbi:MAG TPA: hypothetical protein VGL13_04875 [Polyangiaceae bacterium]|jgi:hypothetical protein